MPCGYDPESYEPKEDLIEELNDVTRMLYYFCRQAEDRGLHFPEGGIEWWSRHKKKDAKRIKQVEEIKNKIDQLENLHAELKERIDVTGAIGSTRQLIKMQLGDLYEELENID